MGSGGGEVARGKSLFLNFHLSLRAESEGAAGGRLSTLRGVEGTNSSASVGLTN